MAALASASSSSKMEAGSTKWRRIIDNDGGAHFSMPSGFETLRRRPRAAAAAAAVRGGGGGMASKSSSSSSSDDEEDDDEAVVEALT